MTSNRFRISVGAQGNDESVTGILDRAARAEKIGLDGMWLIQLPNMRDNLSILAAMAMTTERISLGAGIMPLYTCPPVVPKYTPHSSRESTAIASRSTLT